MISKGLYVKGCRTEKWESPLIIQYQGHFDDLHFTESTFAQPVIIGGQLRIAVRGVFALKSHPLAQLTTGAVTGHLVFDGVSKSERLLLEYIGDPTNPQGFRDPRLEIDGPFAASELRIEGAEFHLEGMLEEPPAWV